MNLLDDDGQAAMTSEYHRLDSLRQLETIQTCTLYNGNKSRSTPLHKVLSSGLLVRKTWLWTITYQIGHRHAGRAHNI